MVLVTSKILLVGIKILLEHNWIWMLDSTKNVPYSPI